MVSGYSSGGSLKFKALVAPPCYTLAKTVSPTSSGIVLTIPANSNGCAASKFVAGQVITLAPRPSINFHFDKWRSLLVNAATNKLTMPAANITINGIFGANMTKGIYSDTYTGIDYSSAWLMQNSALFYGSTQHYTRTKGSTVTVNFTGTHLGIYYNAGRTYGKAVIQIDTRTPVIVNEYSLATTFRNVWWSPALTFGNHKAVITYYNGNPTTTPINFDGVVIQ
jgi:hypothetical protein